MLKPFLRRYTELPFLVDFLHTKQLTLLRPINWDDTNDAYYINQYAQHRHPKAVFVSCLTESEETYHHWRVFSKGAAGVCISFYKDVLMETAQRVPGLRAESVQYRTIQQLRERPPNPQAWPFLKRVAFTEALLHESELARTNPDPQFLHRPMRVRTRSFATSQSSEMAFAPGVQLGRGVRPSSAVRSSIG